MEVQEKQLNEKESLALIATMINKAKDSYYDTGIGCIMWGAVIADLFNRKIFRDSISDSGYPSIFIC